MPGPLIQQSPHAADDSVHVLPTIVPPSTTPLALEVSSFPALARRTPTLRPVSSKRSPRPGPRRAVSRGHSAGSAMANPPVLTQAEYELLPVSIQRKYFSSLERLRIAEHAALQQAKNHTFAQQPTLTRRALPRPDSRRLPRLATKTSLNQLRTSTSSSREQRVSPADAQWFLSLPEKVRRRQFSPEEQVVFTSGLDPVIAAPLKEASPYFHDVHWSDQDQDDLFTIEPEPKVLGRRASLDAAVFGRDQLPSLQHDKMAPPASSLHSASSQRPSQQHGRVQMRRTLSLTTTPFIPFRTSTSSAPSPSAGRNSLSVFRPRTNSYTGAGLGAPLSISTVDPSAKHYQDPNARSKVKNFLASPAKFDEAIEFGFPAERQDAPAEPKIPSPIKASYDAATFLRDESVSCMESLEDYYDDEEEDNDDSTIGDFESPATPSDHGAGFRHGTRLASDFSSFDSSVLGPTWPNLKPQQQSKGPLIENTREMTLRMTLTRPDLRANEDEIYGWQKRSLAKDNPLALVELPPVTDDVDGSHSPFAPNARIRKQSLVGRLMNKVKIGRASSSAF